MTTNLYKNNAAIALAETLKDLANNGYDCYIPVGLAYTTKVIATKSTDSAAIKIKVKYVDKVDNALNLRLQSKIFSLVGRKSQVFDDVDVIAIYNKSLEKPLYVKKELVDLTDNVYSIMLDNIPSDITSIE